MKCRKVRDFLEYEYHFKVKNEIIDVKFHRFRALSAGREGYVYRLHSRLTHESKATGSLSLRVDVNGK